jgi:hypothetical protein
VGLLCGHQELGGLAVGLEGVSCDHHASKVQVAKQWLEGGDLAGGAVDLALGEHGAGGVVHRGEQVDLPAVGVAPRSVLPSTAIARRCRVWSSRLASQAPIAVARASASSRPSVRRMVVSLGRCSGQGYRGGRQVRHGLAGERRRPTRQSRSSSERPQDCGGGHGQDGDEWVAAATEGSRVGDGGQVGEQVRWFRWLERVGVHDFPDKELGKVIPYGVYDPGAGAGWISVGTDHDTAAFAVATLRRWWEQAGRAAYPNAERLLVTADAGGSNGYRVRLWKTELARFAAQTGLAVTVCHFPPGTSKWNKVEHRLFSHISTNWRGRPLVSHEVIVELIAATQTRSGLTVRAELDQGSYPLGVKVSDRELAAVPLRRHDWHGEWNYTVLSAAA